MQYLDDIYTRLALRCIGISPTGSGDSGYGGPYVVELTADTVDITADNTLITADSTEILVDEEI